MKYFRANMNRRVKNRIRKYLHQRIVEDPNGIYVLAEIRGLEDQEFEVGINGQPFSSVSNSLTNKIGSLKLISENQKGAQLSTCTRQYIDICREVLTMFNIEWRQRYYNFSIQRDDWCPTKSSKGKKKPKVGINHC